MIRNTQRWQTFEHDLIATQKLDYAENLRLVEGMYEFARRLGKFTVDDALDGIENTTRLAALLHRVPRTP